MSKIGYFLTGTQTLEEVDSPVNGEITVVKGLAFGTYIQVEGLTQSGGILKSVWRKPLKKLKNKKTEKLKNCLILGLGGGTVAGLVRELWPAGAGKPTSTGKPDVEIIGVDLDPIMVDLGKKYLGLDKYKVNVVIGDAYQYISQKSKVKSQNDKSKLKKHDLILVDLYVGREYPKKFEDEIFLQSIKSQLTGEGIAIFNRLYYGEKRSEAVKFGNKLEKIFRRVDVVYPEANVMY